MEVRSGTSPEWWAYYSRLDPAMQTIVRNTFYRWRESPEVRRRIGAEYDSPKKGRIYRVILANGYRAVARREGNDYRWFFVGTHAEYESVLGLNR